MSEAGQPFGTEADSVKVEAAHAAESLFVMAAVKAMVGPGLMAAGAPGVTATVGFARVQTGGGAARAGQLLTLAVSPVGASLLLPELFGALRARHPGTRVRVMEMAPSAVLPLVRDAVADIGISQRTRAGLDAGLRFKPLFEVQMRVAARPGHPARRAVHARWASWPMRRGLR